MSVSLGGYKFAGYKYVRPENFDASVDAQVLDEVLKMHKCKLKAFTDSCASSGAQWAFSYSAGDYSFGTYGNVIYKLDSGGFNLVSFFRYGTDSAYYAIVTLSDASMFTSGYALTLENRFYYYSGSPAATRNTTALTNNMSCVSLVDLNMTNINVQPTQDRLALASEDTGSLLSGNNSQVISKTIPSIKYFGYATKGKCILSIFSDDITSVAVLKLSAIDLLDLSSPNDSKNIFSWTSSSEKITTTSTPTANLALGYIQTLRDNGVNYEYYGASALASEAFGCALIFPPAKRAISFNPTDNMPYEGASLCATNVYRPQNAPLNADGILTKGAAPVDMLAVNIVFPYASINPKVAYANGNYLFATGYIYTTSSNAAYLLNRFVYVGWDPSNPDINQDSAWPVYSE